MQILLAARFKAWVYGRSLFGIVVSSPTAENMDVCLLRALRDVRYRCRRWADHSFRGILLSALCLSVIVKTG